MGEGEGGAGQDWLYCSGLKRVIQNLQKYTLYIIYIVDRLVRTGFKGVKDLKNATNRPWGQEGGCKIHGRKNLRNKETV